MIRLVQFGKLQAALLLTVLGIGAGFVVFLVSGSPPNLAPLYVLVGFVVGSVTGLVIAATIYEYELKIKLLRIFIMDALSKASAPLQINELAQAVRVVEERAAVGVDHWDNTLALQILSLLTNPAGWVIRSEQGFALTDTGRQVQIVNGKLVVNK